MVNGLKPVISGRTVAAIEGGPGRRLPRCNRMVAPGLDSPVPPPDTPIGPLTLDEVHGLLGDRRRREVLRYLLDGPGSCTLSELAEHVAGVESGKPTSAVTPDERRRAYVALYHRHLPKLVGAGFLDFDGEAHVELADGATDLAVYLSPRFDAADRRRVTRSPAPAALVLAGVGVGTAGSFGLVQLGADGAAVAVAVFATVVAVVSYWASSHPAAADRLGR